MRDTLSEKISEIELSIIVLLFSVHLMNLKCIDYVNFLLIKSQSTYYIILLPQPTISKVPPKLELLFAT